MQLDWSETISGLRMIEVRNLTRRLFDERDIGFIAAQSGLSETASRALAKTLTERGWWQQIEPDVFRATVAGNAMAMSKKLPPLTRENAETLIQQVVSTATAINADPDMAYDITYLSVFGSYLGETAQLNDLDIAYEALGRWRDDENKRAEFDRMIERQNDCYPQPYSSNTPGYLWAGIMVRKRLKVTNRVSVHDREEIDALGWAQKVLIDADPRASGATKAHATFKKS